MSAASKTLVIGMVLGVVGFQPGDTLGATSPVLVNEFMASNAAVAEDPQGHFEDWIELYNDSNQPVDAGGLYLTDDLAAPMKWKVPIGNPGLTTMAPHGFLLIWADKHVADSGLHASFSLDAGGEQVALFDKDGSTLLDSATFGPQVTDTSLGRNPDGVGPWQLMTTPTPGLANAMAYLGVIDDVEWSLKRGFYDGPISVTLSTETEGAEIWYTQDAETPHASTGQGFRGTLYTGPIPVSRTTCIRAIAVKPGWKESAVASHTYIFLEDVIRQPGLPSGFPTTWGGNVVDYAMDQRVVSDPAYAGTIKEDLKAIPSFCIVVPNADLFSASQGIYANAARRHDPDLGQDWERAATMEWIDPNTGIEFGINTGLQMYGGNYSRGSSIAKHGFRVVFKSEYGPSKLAFPLFEDTDVCEFDTLALRSVWNYSWTGHGQFPGEDRITGATHADYIRDAFCRDTIRDMGEWTAHSRFVHLYVNGLYWGLYVLLERPDDRFASQYLGSEAENYDVLKPSDSKSTEMEVMAGDSQAWDALFAVAAGNLSLDANYERMGELVDVGTLVDYMIMVFYVGSRDGPTWLNDDRYPHNFYAIRQRQPAGPFQFLAWDLEWCLELPTENRVTHLGGTANPGLLFKAMGAHPEFRTLVADRIHRHFFNGGLLSPNIATQRYQARSLEIDRAIVGESARWGDSQRPSWPFTRNVEWITEQDRLVKSYFSVRTGIVLEQLKAAGWYPAVDAPMFHINGTYQHGGHVPSGGVLAVVNPSGQGEVYVSLDGSDPGSMLAAEPKGTILVSEQAAKRVLIPGGDIGDSWRTDPAFRDDSWISGTGGVGYELGTGYEQYIGLDCETDMFGQASGCYVRIPFDVNDPTLIDSITLQVRYDDGFAAYINGVKVAERNAAATLVWNSSATASREADHTFENFNIPDAGTILWAGRNLLAIHALNEKPTSPDFLICAQVLAQESANPQDGPYTGPISLTQSSCIKARTLLDGQWSALNEAVYAVGPVAEGLRVSEMMIHPSGVSVEDPNTDSKTEFIELTNIGTDTINLSLVRFTHGIDFTFPSADLASGQHVLVVQDVNAFEAVYGKGLPVLGEYMGNLSNEGERIALEDAAGQTILDFRYRGDWYDLADGRGFSMIVRDVNGAEPNQLSEKGRWQPCTFADGSPGMAEMVLLPAPDSIVINEVLANSPAGRPDWIELHNTTGQPLDLSGWFLSDDGGDPTEYQIQPGTIIQGLGYLVFYQDKHFGSTNNPGCRKSFGLGADGETVYLRSGSNGQLTGYARSQSFDAAEAGVSLGRYCKSTVAFDFVAMELNTPGAANSEAQVGPIVINEIMYHPGANEGAEYMEVLNWSQAAVTLYNSTARLPWRFTDGSDGTGIDFAFPTNPAVVLLPGEYLVLVKDKTLFTATYTVPPSVQVLEWGLGNLGNGGGRPQIDKPVLLGSQPAWVRADRISYSDGSHPEDFASGVDPWPTYPDGSGEALGRISAQVYGNDAGNWQSVQPSPGRANY